MITDHARRVVPRARRAARAAGVIVVAAFVAGTVFTSGTLLGLVLLAHGYPLLGAAVGVVFAAFALVIRSGVLPPPAPREVTRSTPCPVSATWPLRPVGATPNPFAGASGVVR